MQLKPVPKLETYPVDVLEISHSSLQSFHSCPRKLEFAKLYGFNLKSRNAAGDGGNAIHKAVGTYLTTKSKDEAVYELMRAYPIDLQDNPLWNWSLEACYATLLSIIDWLNNNSQCELAKVGDKLAIEVPFLINIKHGIKGLLPVVYRGYIDFIFYNRIENTYTVLDLKNTTQNTNDFTPKYKFDSQCLPYGIVLKRALDEHLKSLSVQYLVSKVDLQPPAPQLLEFEKDEQDIHEWMQDLIMDLTSIKTYIETQWFPRRGSSCISFNRVCSYFELCHSRNLKTISLMLSSRDKPEEKPFDPWISLDLQITN